MVVNEKTLDKILLKNGIHPADVRESFVRSSGPGGQNVNKVSTCVMLEYPKADVTVRCQKERSQMANRYLARLQLIEKVRQKEEQRRALFRQQKEKKKRQNRKRPARLKEKILQAKKKQSEKKAQRKKIRPGDSE